jgi:6-phosphogluconolactonase (cycloisomerase 2 family)
VVIGVAANDNFGSSVAFSADAKKLVVGAPGELSVEKKGYVTVYVREDIGGNMTQLGQTILGEAVDDFFGDSVDISADGKTLAIGSPGINDRPGYVRVYQLESHDDLDFSWKQLGQNITGEAIADHLGCSVSLSDDGKTLAVGAYKNDYSGHVRIYHLDEDGSWKQLGEDICGEAFSNFRGISVSLSGNGTTVAIGAPWNSDYGTYSGNVKVHRIDSEGSCWEQLGQIIYGETENDYFG